MIRKFAIIIACCTVFIIAFFIAIADRERQNPNANSPFPKTNMLLISPSFNTNGPIPRKFTCDAFDKLSASGGINPELHIQNVPENAKSLALIMHDPDAPMPGGFTHWVMWNINPKTTRIQEGNVPDGAHEGMNSRSAGYTGPCPPTGTHRYVFTLFALDNALLLPAGTTKSNLESAMQRHIIAEAELVGLYKKWGN